MQHIITPLLIKEVLSMDKDTFLKHYQNMKSTIDRLRRGRTIVLLGDSETYREFLESEYGLSDPMIITTVKKKAGDRFTHIMEIKNMNDQYFIVAPKQKKTLEMQLRLYSYGYEDFEDCFFFNHDKITIDEGVKDYTDGYGNHIHAPSCRVVLDEYVCMADISVDESCTFGEESFITVKTVGGARVNIEKKCTFEDNVTFSVFGDGCIDIGSGTTFVRNTEVTVLAGMKLGIGKDCLFSCEIKLYCGDGHAIFDVTERKRINTQDKNNPKNIISIADHVWVGMRSIILNKTVIGQSSVVGAGSVVKGIFPNNCILAGNPARIIRKNTTWSANSLRNDMAHIPEEYIALTSEE